MRTHEGRSSWYLSQADRDRSNLDIYDVCHNGKMESWIGDTYIQVVRCGMEHMLQYAQKD